MVVVVRVDVVVGFVCVVLVLVVDAFTVDIVVAVVKTPT